jgi:hypothetical protein
MGPAYPNAMRPATRKFKRQLDEKIERLEPRIKAYEKGELEPLQNPGYDRLAEARYLKGEWDAAKAASRKAVGYWKERLAAEKADPQKCEPTFHLGSAYLFAADAAGAVRTFAQGVALFAGNGLAGSDDTGYMAAVAGDLRRAEVVFHAAVVADMGAQGMSDLKLFAKRFPDTPRLLKLQFVQGLQKKDRALIENMRLMERWLTPEAEGITSFRTEEWFYAGHQVVLGQLTRGEPPEFRLYGEGVQRGLTDAEPRK